MRSSFTGAEGQRALWIASSNAGSNFKALQKKLQIRSRPKAYIVREGTRFTNTVEIRTTDESDGKRLLTMIVKKVATIQTALDNKSCWKVNGSYEAIGYTIRKLSKYTRDFPDLYSAWYNNDTRMFEIAALPSKVCGFKATITSSVKNYDDHLNAKATASTGPSGASRFSVLEDAVEVSDDMPVQVSVPLREQSKSAQKRARKKKRAAMRSNKSVVSSAVVTADTTDDEIEQIVNKFTSFADICDDSKMSWADIESGSMSEW